MVVLYGCAYACTEFCDKTCHMCSWSIFLSLSVWDEMSNCTYSVQVGREAG